MIKLRNNKGRRPLEVENTLAKKVTEKKENYDMLTVLAVCLGGPGTILKKEFDIAMTKTMEREAMEMCNLSQGIVDRTTINHIISIMRNIDMSEEQCMDLLDIPQEHRELYHMMLQDKMEVSHV